jgi:hypothetical protein
MSTHDATTRETTVHLNDEDIAYLMNVLRNATQPVTTQQLIDVLRRHSGEPSEAGRES